MTFTEEEEQILKLMALEVKARMKANIEREAEETDFREAWIPLRAQIEAAHKETLDPLKEAARIAREELKDFFK